MAAINFEESFELLQLPIGASLIDLKNQYNRLINQKERQDQIPKIIEAYSNLQLLLRPYEELDFIERKQLSESLSQLSSEKQKRLFQAYPHRSFTFFRDQFNFEKSFVSDGGAKGFGSSLLSFARFFIPCFDSFKKKTRTEEESIYDKKNQ